MVDPQLKTISLRLDEGLWAECKSIAKAKNMSLNEFIERSLVATAEAERRAKIRSALMQIAESDVEYAFGAQSEVVLDETDTRP